MADLTEADESMAVTTRNGEFACTERLAGRTQQRFFSAGGRGELRLSRCVPGRFQQARGIRRGRAWTPGEINPKLRELMSAGLRHHRCPESRRQALARGRHPEPPQSAYRGSLGYFGCGLIDGPNVHIKGRVGWSCGENMMAGTVVIEKNAGSTFGAAMRGGDLVCKGDVGGRTGIDMKGGTIIVGGRTGAFSGFMMQRGRMVILGDAGKNLGDSMYDGTIYVGGKIDGPLASTPFPAR